MSRILIADDEPRITAFIEKGLAANGFSTLAVHDGESAVQLARDDDFDLLVLDLGMPDRDGFDVLRELRGRGETIPVIVLTARDEVESKVAGFELGADDYLTKPFSFDELLVRIRARLRSHPDGALSELKAGGVTLDIRTRRATVDGRTVDLSGKEFVLAETFLRHPGQVLTREQLLSRVWGYDFATESNVVEVYVGYVRKKLGRDVIETVRGVGYRFRG